MPDSTQGTILPWSPWQHVVRAVHELSSPPVTLLSHNSWVTKRLVATEIIKTVQITFMLENYEPTRVIIMEVACGYGIRVNI